MLVLTVALMGTQHLLFAGSRPRAPRLAVISTPAGTGFEAAIGDALIPDSRSGRYRLIPIAELTREKAAVSDGDAGVDGGVDSPKEAIAEKAREAALAFNLVHAAVLWRMAADEVLHSEAIAMDLPQAASYLLEAGAASAAAGEADLAHAYFRKALGINLDITPGPEISPDAKALFHAARKEGPVQTEIPRDNALEAVCEALGVDGLVWISVGNERSALIVSSKVFLRGKETTELETRSYPISQKKVAPKWLEAEQARLDTAIAYKLFGAPKTVPDRKTPAAKKPWFKKWWFYTAVGGVLIGGAAGLTSYFLLREDKADVVVHF